MTDPIQTRSRFLTLGADVVGEETTVDTAVNDLPELADSGARAAPAAGDDAGANTTDEASTQPPPVAPATGGDINQPGFIKTDQPASP